jgi:hypothetical protein
MAKATLFVMSDPGEAIRLVWRDFPSALSLKCIFGPKTAAFGSLNSGLEPKAGPVSPPDTERSGTGLKKNLRIRATRSLTLFSSEYTI